MVCSQNARSDTHARTHTHTHTNTHTHTHTHTVQAHCNIGVLLREAGDLKGAVAAYEQALLCAPSFPIVLSNLAIALTDLATQTKAEVRLDGGAGGAAVCVWGGEGWIGGGGG